MKKLLVILSALALLVPVVSEAKVPKKPAKVFKHHKKAIGNDVVPTKKK
jgi:hypothetical protein